MPAVEEIVHAVAAEGGGSINSRSTSRSSISSSSCSSSSSSSSSTVRFFKYVVAGPHGSGSEVV